MFFAPMVSMSYKNPEPELIAVTAMDACNPGFIGQKSARTSVASSMTSQGPKKPKRSYMPLSLSCDDISMRVRHIEHARRILLRKNSISSPYLHNSKQPQIKGLRSKASECANGPSWCLLRVNSERSHQEQERHSSSSLNSKLILELAEEEMEAKLHWLFVGDSKPANKNGNSGQLNHSPSSQSLLQTKQILLGLQANANVNSRGSRKDLFSNGTALKKEAPPSFPPSTSAKKKPKETSGGRKYGRSLSGFLKSKSQLQAPSTPPPEHSTKSFFGNRKQSLASALNSSMKLNTTPDVNKEVKEDRRQRRKSEASGNSSRFAAFFSSGASYDTVEGETKSRFRIRSMSRGTIKSNEIGSDTTSGSSSIFKNSPVLKLKNAFFSGNRSTQQQKTTAVEISYPIPVKVPFEPNPINGHPLLRCVESNSRKPSTVSSKSAITTRPNALEAENLRKSRSMSTPSAILEQVLSGSSQLNGRNAFPSTPPRWNDGSMPSVIHHHSHNNIAKIKNLQLSEIHRRPSLIDEINQDLKFRAESQSNLKQQSFNNYVIGNEVDV
ncbi:hypothetical protein Ddc_07479 [Ditylenchus destructor]|nr:hypothetical protein Ddc_07479 [Ditylenchus destructor]